jgi:hypothetical protein
MRQKLQYDDSSDDGVFWMCFEDFAVNFRNLYVCRLFETVDKGGRWYKYTAAARWSVADDTAGGCPNEPTCSKNPQFYVDVGALCTVFVSLAQSEPMGADRDALPAIGFKMCAKGGNRVRNVYQVCDGSHTVR